MPVSGLVVHLERAPELAAAALSELRRTPDLELGEVVDGRRVPAVLATASAADGKAAVRRIEARRGVARVEVAFVALDERSGADRSEAGGG